MMENRFGIYDILQNIREDEQRLERLIADLKKEKKPCTVKYPNPTFPPPSSTCPRPIAKSRPCST